MNSPNASARRTSTRSRTTNSAEQARIAEPTKPLDQSAWSAIRSGRWRGFAVTFDVPPRAAPGGSVLHHRFRAPTAGTEVQSSLSSQSCRRGALFVSVEHACRYSASCSSRLRAYQPPAQASSKLSGPVRRAISASLRRSSVRNIRRNTGAKKLSARNSPCVSRRRGGACWAVAANACSRTSMDPGTLLIEAIAFIEHSFLSGAVRPWRCAFAI